MREKWRVSRGWIKMHAMIDVETNQALGLENTDESVQDDQMFIPLLDQTQQHNATTQSTGLPYRTGCDGQLSDVVAAHHYLMR